MTYRDALRDLTAAIGYCRQLDSGGRVLYDGDSNIMSGRHEDAELTRATDQAIALCHALAAALAADFPHTDPQ